ncbi:hypothetical protein F4775DRAFT_217401 [Biscogniauxia sp. FL1348]|nr:hypothetical protein F4775DRAFT_217401 [Biscogniauxia sp. FL1348]
MSLSTTGGQEITMSILDTIPREIVLAIIHEMDLRTIMVFMRTCKRYAQFIRTHEISICTNISRRYTIPPSGMIFTSNALDREIAVPGKFPILAELELRESRIEFLVKRIHMLSKSSMFITVTGFSATTPAQRERLTPLLRRALWQCDAISDIAARVPVIPEEDMSDMNERERQEYEAYCNAMDQIALDDPYRFVNARAAQLAYVRGLATEDLAALLLLVTVLGTGYARLKGSAHVRGRLDTEDIWGPHARERALIFEETTLRHGSWFLWAEICGSASMRTHAHHMIWHGCDELTEFEAGAPFAPPGIKMTLMEQLRRRFQADAGADTPPPGNRVIVKAFNVIRRIIGMKLEVEDDEKKQTGDEEEEEAEEIETPAPAPAPADAENADAAGQAAILAQEPADAA